MDIKDKGESLDTQYLIQKIMKHKWELGILLNEFLKMKGLIEGRQENTAYAGGCLSSVNMSVLVTGIGLLDVRIWDMKHSLLRTLKEIIAPTKIEVFPTNLRQTVIDEMEVDIKMRRDTCDTMDKWGCEFLHGNFDSNDEYYSTDEDKDEKWEDEMSNAWRKNV